MFPTLTAIHFEVWLALGYSAFLVLVSFVLERMARHTHHRSGHYSHAGFRFQKDQDVWECPEGEPLRRMGDDLAKKVIRYRARSEVCNGCRLKAQCTDSLNGREIHRSTENWIDSEIGRFHRGLSLALLALATLIASVVLVRHHAPPETAILGAVLLCIALLARLLTREILAIKAEAARSPWSQTGGTLNGSPFNSAARRADSQLQIETSDSFNGKK